MSAPDVLLRVSAALNRPEFELGLVAQWNDARKSASIVD